MARARRIRTRSAARLPDRIEQVLLVTMGALICVGLMVGGSAADRPPGFFLVSVLSAAALGVAIWRLLQAPDKRDNLALALCLAIVIVPLVQLIPLPAAVWERLPGRDLAVQSANLVQAADAHRALSLTPGETFAAIGWLLAPVAAFLATMAIGPRGRRWLVGLYLLGAALGVLLGLYEIYLGPDRTPLPYEFMNAGLPTGFFANRNHQAAGLALAIVLAAGWVHGAERDQNGRDLAPRYVFLGLAALYTAGALATLSRAGVILLTLAIFSSVMLLAADPIRRRLGRTTSYWLLAAGAILAALFALGLQPVLARFDAVATESRLEFWPPLLDAAHSFFPWGSGLGSFRSIANAALPVELLSPAYVNEAHNEYVQLWMEAGVAFPLLLLGFLSWLARQAARGSKAGLDGLQVMALTGIGLLLLHSFFDYPLRTPAMAIAFGILCGLLTQPRSAGRRENAGDQATRDR